uniref:Apple domain-containing protein n=1 Tax=Strongyloides papillosus TaxID=174720 RepID=A0A0N5B5L2_STREA
MNLKYLFFVLTILCLSQCLRAGKKCSFAYSLSGKINGKKGNFKDTKSEGVCEEQCVKMTGKFKADEDNYINGEINACMLKSACDKYKEGTETIDKAYDLLYEGYTHGKDIADFRKVLAAYAKNPLTSATREKMKGSYKIKCCDGDLCNKGKKL